MKEKDGNIPFDLNHNKTFTYSHMGEDIGYTETTRCVKELTNLIIEIDKSKEVDSPLFHNIRGVQPYILPEEEYIQVIKDLAEKEKSLFALVENAKVEMKKENFAQATKLWKKACEKVQNDSYFIQQYALCTYKDSTISPDVALIDALGIIKKLEPENRNTNDPETLGITGAIYKRLWLNSPKSIEYLNRAVDYYKRGFTINQDYYTGENYALCLDLKSEVITDEHEKIYLEIEARKTRQEILSIIDTLKEDEDFEIRSDLKWIYATLANCNLALGNNGEYESYEAKFLSSNPDSWNIESYMQSIDKIKSKLSNNGKGI
jgi:tetratricopeptide (TPR) repeat protein